MRRFISLCLALCLISSVFCVAGAAAQSGTVSDTLSWEFSNIGHLIIKGEGDTIPDYEEEENGQSTAPWGAFAGQIMSLSLPASLTSIGDYAFAGCANLKEVNLPSHPAHLGKGAFKNCGITALDLPYTLHEISDECFAGCEELVSVKFNEVTSGGMGVVLKDGVESIGKSAFEFCFSLERLDFPSTLKVIGKEAFNECLALKSVSFADNGEALESIGEGAFSYCTELTSFTIPETITQIAADTFKGAGLKTVRLHKNITEVGKNAFAFCSDLVRIDVYASDCAFYASDTTIPDSTNLYCVGSAKKTIAYAEKYAKAIAVLCVGRVSSHAKFSTKLTKSSAAAPGKAETICPSCGWTRTQVIPQVKTVKLTKTAFIYNAKKQAPTAAQVRITDASGKVIDSANYTVKCGSVGKEVGTHWVRIAFTASSNYQGSFKRYYTIVPKGTAIKSVTAGKGTLKVAWNKQATQTTGYQIRLCKRADFKSGVILKTVKNNKSTVLSVPKLARKTGYYIQIRTYKTVSGKHYFSTWSKSFGRKTK